jgi:hypothetical protein
MIVCKHIYDNKSYTLFDTKEEYNKDYTRSEVKSILAKGTKIIGLNPDATVDETYARKSFLYKRGFDKNSYEVGTERVRGNYYIVIIKEPVYIFLFDKETEELLYTIETLKDVSIWGVHSEKGKLYVRYNFDCGCDTTWATVTYNLSDNGTFTMEDKMLITEDNDENYYADIPPRYYEAVNLLTNLGIKEELTPDRDVMFSVYNKQLYRLFVDKFNGYYYVGKDGVNCGQGNNTRKWIYRERNTEC